MKSAASFALNRHVDVNDLSQKIDASKIKVRHIDTMLVRCAVTNQIVKQSLLNALLLAGCISCQLARGPKGM